MNIRDLSKARIVVVGDAMIDLYIHGRVDRISPEAPVPVFVEESREKRAGGAANVVENLRALGCKVEYPFTVKSAVKTRFMVNNRQMFRHDEEDCSAIGQETAERIFVYATRHDCDVLIISDYAKGVCTPSLCQRLIAWAKEKSAKVVVDPKGRNWSKYRGCDAITPNQVEIDKTNLYHQPRDAGRSLLDLYDIGACLVTKGANGMSLEAPHPIHIPATNTGPVDVCGCGDTVIAILAAAIAVGYDLETAARLSNVGAGIVAGKFGTATCSLTELEEAYARHEAPSVCVRTLQAR